MKRMTLQPEKEEITFEELFDDFIRFKKVRNLSPSTINYYEDCYKFFCEFFNKKECCMTITEDTFYQYIEYLKENKPDLSPATIDSYLTGLRAILYYGIKKEYISKFQVQLPKMDETIKETYTDAEVKLLLQKPDIKKCNFAEYRNWVIVNYMLGTGNRLSTITNIKIEDVDFESGNIVLRKVKNRRQYYIPLSKSLSHILNEYLLYRKGEPSDYLFCTVYNRKMAESGLEGQIAKYNRKRGVQKTSMHIYRHIFAKNWILNGGDIFRLQKILGHRSLDMVRKYVNMFSNDLKKDFDAFNPLDNFLQNDNKGDRISLHK